MTSVCIRLGTLARVALVLGLFSAPAHAQDASGKAAAEALFEEGVALMKAGRFAEACPKLVTSLRLDQAVGTLLYLAECYERTGRTASAWATFREAESLGRSQNQLDRARTAQSRAQKLEPELAYLTISVPPEARVDGLLVRRGTTTVYADLYGVSTPVDPGPIEVEASAPGHRTFTGSVRVAPKARETLTVPKLEPLPVAETPPATAPSEPAPAPSTPLTEPAPSGLPKDEGSEQGANHTAAYIVGGVGIVALGVGSYFGLRAMSKNSEAEDSCDANNVCTDPRALTLTDEARDAANFSNIGFAVGGAALATSIVLFIVAPGGDETNALRVAPTVARGGGGISLGGKFQ